MRISITNWLAALLITLAWSAIGFAENAKASEPPSTAELYAMILDIREENRNLRAELEKLKGARPSENASRAADPVVTASRPMKASYAYAPAASAMQEPEHSNGPSVTMTYEALFMGSESNGSIDMSNFDLSLANRFEFEAKGADHLGLRARTFGFGSMQNENSSYFCCDIIPESIAFEQKYEIDVESYDVEITSDLLKKGSFDLDGSIGIRYASLANTSKYQDKIYTQELTNNNSGLGPTIALDATYNIGNFAIVSSVRQSVEIMSSDFEYSIEATNGFDDFGIPKYEVDALGMQTELSAGVEYSNRLSNGVQVMAGVGVEWQYWNVSGTGFDDTVYSCSGCIFFVPFSNTQDVASELNLFGLTANIALQF